LAVRRRRIRGAPGRDVEGGRQIVRRPYPRGRREVPLLARQSHHGQLRRGQPAGRRGDDGGGSVPRGRRSAVRRQTGGQEPGGRCIDSAPPTATPPSSSSPAPPT